MVKRVAQTGLRSRKERIYQSTLPLTTKRGTLTKYRERAVRLTTTTTTTIIIIIIIIIIMINFIIVIIVSSLLAGPLRLQ